MSNRNMSAVLFDLDETLMDRRKALDVFINRLIRDYGEAFGLKDRNRIFDIVREADQGGYRAKREVYLDLIRLLLWSGAPSEEQFAGYWRRVYPGCAQPATGMREVLSFFRYQGIRIGLITNGQSEVQQAKIDILGIREWFDSIVVSEEAGCKKPDASIFKLALETLGVNPSDAWYVGDHPRNDVYGARQAGLFAVWKQGVHVWDDALSVRPDAVVTELTELAPLYLKLNKP